MTLPTERTHRHTLSRRRVLAGGFTAASAVAFGGSALVAATAPTAAAPTALAQEDPLARLQAGNERYRNDQATHPNQSPARREEVASGQHPFVLVLGCADSRVPPEVVFDQGLGDVFDVRVAGNVVDDVAFGSIEYAVEHLHTPLAVVLGHEGCGAVSATIDAMREGASPPHGHVGALVDRIRPAVEQVVGGPVAPGAPGDPIDPALLDDCVQANVRAVAAQLPADSEIVGGAVDSGALRIVGGRYDLDSGEFTLTS